MKIKLTENKLRQMVSEAVKNVLSEVTHGWVSDKITRVDDVDNPWNYRDRAKINPKKTPEQIAAQKDRITKQFNDIYGSDNIKYDFDKNKNERYYGKIRQPDTTFHPEYTERDRWQGTINRGGVTFTDKDGKSRRYTPGEKSNVYLRNGNMKSDDTWDWDSAPDFSKQSTPVAIDSKGKAKTANEFTADQINALNNVAYTYTNGLKYPNSPWNKEREVKRGKKPFKTN